MLDLEGLWTRYDDPSDLLAEVAGLLDECWYLDVDDDVRRTRLQARHERFGRTPAQARERTWGSDERNASVVAASRDRASAVVVGGRPG